MTPRTVPKTKRVTGDCKIGATIAKTPQIAAKYPIIVVEVINPAPEISDNFN
ncbi:hypothetical protein [uncultured Cohaesibacter sp.]|uniref:hypothetical protein n=1 Tax=uncultured Cohaesibacter sp. TaxID=1002546 RepID=UPI0029C840AB|nr:hypothetical protein [uncultured Cohaesibacter sp.]